MIDRYFAFEHLPEHLRSISEPICTAARSDEHPRVILELVFDHLQDLAADGRVVDEQQLEFGIAKVHEAEKVLDREHRATDAFLLLLIEIKDCAVRACLPTAPPKPTGCCSAPRIAHASAKCSDRCSFDPPDGEGESRTGYVPEGVGIGGGDYLEIEYCLSCGRLAGDFPVNLEEG